MLVGSRAWFNVPSPRAADSTGRDAQCCSPKQPNGHGLGSGVRPAEEVVCAGCPSDPSTDGASVTRTFCRLTVRFIIRVSFKMFSDAGTEEPTHSGSGKEDIDSHMVGGQQGGKTSSVATCRAAPRPLGCIPSVAPPLVLALALPEAGVTSPPSGCPPT